MISVSSPAPDTSSTAEVITQSCTICRHLKVKCVRAMGPNAPCARCEKTGAICANPVLGKRGRPKKSEVSRRSSTQAQTNTAISATTDASTANIDTVTNIIDPARTVRRRPNQEVQLGAAPNLSANITAPQQLDTGVTPGGATLASGQTVEGSPSAFRLANYLDPDQASVTAPQLAEAPTVTRAPQHDDPVNLLILSVFEARRLVEEFYAHLNPLIAVLDPKLHAFDALRLRSTPLFTAVLCAAAKYSRADLHPALLTHSQTVIERAILAGMDSPNLVQSISISVYFQPSGDASAWRKIGWAIRMGYQFRWHEPRKRPLPSEELAKREVLDKERAWIRLYCFDFAYSNLYDLPMTIKPHEVGEVDQWALEHVDLNLPIDMHLACAVDAIRLRQHWRLFVSQATQATHAGSREYNKIMVEDMLSRCRALTVKWFNETTPIPGFDQAREMRSRCSFLEFQLAIQKFALRLEPHDATILDNCLSLADEIVKQTETLDAAGGLRWLPDLPMTATTALALFLKDTLWRLSPQQQVLAEHLLQRLQAAYARASQGDERLATALVARFMGRMLADVQRETNRSNGTLGAVNSMPSISTPAREADMTAFLDSLALRPLAEPMAPSALPSDENHQYWSEVFGGLFDQWQASSGPF